MARHAVHCFTVLGRDSSHHRDISVSECCLVEVSKPKPLQLD